MTESLEPRRLYVVEQDNQTTDVIIEQSQDESGAVIPDDDTMQTDPLLRPRHEFLEQLPSNDPRHKGVGRHRTIFDTRQSVYLRNDTPDLLLKTPTQEWQMMEGVLSKINFFVQTKNGTPVSNQGLDSTTLEQDQKDNHITAFPTVTITNGESNFELAWHALGNNPSLRHAEPSSNLQDAHKQLTDMVVHSKIISCQSGKREPVALVTPTEEHEEHPFAGIGYTKEGLMTAPLSAEYVQAIVSGEVMPVAWAELTPDAIVLSGLNVYLNQDNNSPNRSMFPCMIVDTTVEPILAQLDPIMVTNRSDILSKAIDQITRGPSTIPSVNDVAPAITTHTSEPREPSRLAINDEDRDMAGGIGMNGVVYRQPDLSGQGRGLRSRLPRRH